MNIELTNDEAQFIIDNILQLSVPFSTPNMVQIAILGSSVLAKVQKAMKEVKPEAKAAQA